MSPVIETPRLILRKPGATDVEAALAFWASDRSGVFGGPKGRSDAWRMFAANLGHWEIRGFGLFIITRQGDDRALGIVGPHRPEGFDENEIGWVLYDAATEGQGIATEAARAARGFAYATLGWDTAVSYVAPDNLRSRRLAERLGAAPDIYARHSFDRPCIVYRHPAPGAAAEAAQ